MRTSEPPGDDVGAGAVMDEQHQRAGATTIDVRAGVA
jgi:hypothetical protein